VRRDEIIVSKQDWVDVQAKVINNLQGSLWFKKEEKEKRSED